jgi:ethanolaminephosphotransferase
MVNLLRKRYLTNDSLKRLEKFQYSGSNISYSYNWIISPLLDNYIMKIIPLWLAPNLITIISFIFNLLAFLLLCYETRLNLEVRVSNYTMLFKAFSHLAYLILDNADGKQARRTKTSSPLGLLLDHGFDAITTAIVAYNCSLMVMLGNNSISSYFLFLGLFFGYFIANYEEYKTGKMILGVVNGPDDGNIVVCLVAIFAYFFGPEKFHMVIFGVKIANFFVFGVCFGTFICTIESIRNITRGKNFFEEMKILFVDSFWFFNALLLPLFTYLIDSKYYFNNIWTFLILMTVIFLRIGIEILINIVCVRKMRSNYSINISILLWYVIIILKFIGMNGSTFYLFYNLFLVMAALNSIELIKFMLSATLEIRDHLNLSLFFIPSKENK